MILLENLSLETLTPKPSPWNPDPWIDWILELEIVMTFLYWRISNIGILEVIQCITLNLGIWKFSSNLLKFLLRFWNCVGCAYMRGCFDLKITRRVNLYTLVISRHKISGTYCWKCLKIFCLELRPMKNTCSFIIYLLG